MSTNFNIVPKDIEGVLIYLDNFTKKVEALENSHQEVKDAISKLEKRLLNIIIVVIVAIGAKYGLDLTGITP